MTETVLSTCFPLAPPPRSTSRQHNVAPNVAMKTPQFIGLGVTNFFVGCTGFGLFSVAKPMMGEVFSNTLPTLVTASFASAYVQVRPPSRPVDPGARPGVGGSGTGKMIIEKIFENSGHLLRNYSSLHDTSSTGGLINPPRPTQSIKARLFYFILLCGTCPR